MKTQTIDPVFSLAKTCKTAIPFVTVMLALAVVMPFAQAGPPPGGNPPTAGNTVTSPPSAVIEKNLRVFLALAAQDASVSALLHKHKLMLQYTITDLRLNCHVGFDEGRVVGALRAATRSPELVFVSDAAALDRLLKGGGCESDTEMTVHLGLVRKIRLAKDLKAIRVGLARVYQSACDRVVAERTANAVAAKN